MALFVTALFVTGLAPAEAHAETLWEAFPPPAGAHREATTPFGVWLGTLPLREEGADVRAWDGQVVDIPHARVVALDVTGQRNLQCADTALRLRATWERLVGQAPAFHYTSGDVSAWSSWAAGTRPRVRGSSVTFVAHAAAPDTSERAFAAWLADLYTYAGTRSLHLDTVSVTAPTPGDVLVVPGSPGHAVVILDVATEGTHQWVLVGQGYMPAMELHVPPGPDAGWFPVQGEVLPTEPIPMPWSTLRRWVE